MRYSDLWVFQTKNIWSKLAKNNQKTEWYCYCHQHHIATIEEDGNKYCFLFQLFKRVVGLFKGEIIGQSKGATTLQRNPFFSPLASFFILSWAPITVQIQEITPSELEKGLKSAIWALSSHAKLKQLLVRAKKKIIDLQDMVNQPEKISVYSSFWANLKVEAKICLMWGKEKTTTPWLQNNRLHDPGLPGQDTSRVFSMPQISAQLSNIITASRIMKTSSLSFVDSFETKNVRREYHWYQHHINGNRYLPSF